MHDHTAQKFRGSGHPLDLVIERQLTKKMKSVTDEKTPDADFFVDLQDICTLNLLRDKAESDERRNSSGTS